MFHCRLYIYIYIWKTTVFWNSECRNTFEKDGKPKKCPPAYRGSAKFAHGERLSFLYTKLVRIAPVPLHLLLVARWRRCLGTNQRIFGCQKTTVFIFSARWKFVGSGKKKTISDEHLAVVEDFSCKKLKFRKQKISFFFVGGWFLGKSDVADFLDLEESIPIFSSEKRWNFQLC